MQEAYTIEDQQVPSIAIIGMAGRFPGANSVDAFWQNLLAGKEAIRHFSDEELVASGVDEQELRRPDYVKAGAVLENIDQFDAQFFGFSPREARLLDPQHRLFLECVWEALEQAGYNPDTYQGRIGLFAGESINTYLLYNLCTRRDFISQERLYETMLANEKDFLATRAAYKCNLKGPSVTVQTACSTSLVATHLACQSLLNGETDIALAGGATVRVPHKTGYIYRESGILSPDGHCRAFDASARGTVGGNGVGVVVLKRLTDALADHDHIIAIIRGSAMNNDGSLKAGYTAPSEEGQATVIAEALMMAGVEPDTITYIETHGTGTAIGDPIEVAALTQVFGTPTRSTASCAIGSVKTNIGHLDAAAGIAGLIKTALALKYRQIPPSLHFEQANPKIDFAHSPFFINTQLTEWKEGPTPRRAGVSSFGIGGTNVHVVLEEPPTTPQRVSTPGWQLLPLSAKTPGALEHATTNLAASLQQQSDLPLEDVAYTLQVGRKAFSHRRFLVCQNTEDAITILKKHDTERLLTTLCPTEQPDIVFMFSGQGTQYLSMAQGLYHNEPVFRSYLDICSTHVQNIANINLHELLYPTENDLEQATNRLTQTAVSQPLIFSIEYALAQLWMSWGIHPHMMIGHSIGEYVAACLAGVFSLEDALRLVVARGQLMQAQPAGTMLAVPLSEEALESLLGPEISLAAVNGPTACVIAGTQEAIAIVEDTLSQQGVDCRRLHTSHAFHSQMMEPVLEPFRQQVQAISLHEPRIPYISNVTGTWITAKEATDPAYWARHVRSTVRFSQGIACIQQRHPRIFLEVGPGHTLSTLVKRHPSTTKDQVIVSSLRHPHSSTADMAFLLTTAGKLWLANAPIAWERLHNASNCTRIPLPTYPFERQRYWIEPATTSITAQTTSPQETEEVLEEAGASSTSMGASRSYSQQAYVAPRNHIEATLAEIWQQLLGIEQIGIHDNFFDLGGDSFMAVQIISQVKARLHTELFMHQIVEAPTVARLARLLQDDAAQTQQGGKAKSATPLVALKPEGKRLPLFCIHPAGGTVLCYLDLARYLDPEQPLYGLQTPGLAGGHQHETIEEVATSYIEAIRSVQPHGPYLLGGMSYGGNVAFEMARQLHQQGEGIELLALFDSHPPISYQGQEPNDTEFLAAFPWILNMYLGRSQKPPFTYQDLQQIDQDQQLAYVFDQITRSNLFPMNMNLQELHQFFDIWKVHHHSLRQYNPPPKVYPFPITLFQAMEDQPPELLELLKINLSNELPITGWEALSTAPLQVYRVPGNHYTMLNEPYVQTLAKHIHACLFASVAGGR